MAQQFQDVKTKQEPSQKAEPSTPATVEKAPQEAKEVSPKIEGPKVLAVVAHPDDEAYFSGTIYRLTAHFKGQVDIVVVTNGEGGYKYADLAEPVYKKGNLTDEAVGRKELPAIREAELRNGGRILGINEYVLLNQKDDKFTGNEKDILDSKLWDLERVRDQISTALKKENYDYVFTILPDSEEHAGHKVATLIALRAVEDLPEKDRPVVLGADLALKLDTPRVNYAPPEGHDEALLEENGPELVFSRMVPFGYVKPGTNDLPKLTIKDITDAHITQHLSQGASQAWVKEKEAEQFFVFAVSPDSKMAQTIKLFEELALPPKPEMLVGEKKN